MDEKKVVDRPEWRPRKKLSREVRADARTRARAELPPPEDIRRIAISTLLEVAMDLDAPHAARVGASGRLLEAFPAAIQVSGWVPPQMPAGVLQPAPDVQDGSWT